MFDSYIFKRYRNRICCFFFQSFFFVHREFATCEFLKIEFFVNDVFIRFYENDVTFVDDFIKTFSMFHLIKLIVESSFDFIF